MSGSLVLSRAEAATFAWLKKLMADTAVPCHSLEWQWRNHGFGELIMPVARDWKKSEKVLDAGCGYSPLPNFLAETFGVEMWSADDFGGDDTFWRRDKDPAGLAKQVRVRHVYEPIGKIDSSLPSGYFDVVYSKLGLHIAPAPQWSIWRHFAQLLSDRKGSSLYILANIGSLCDGDPASALQRFDDVRRIEDEVAIGLERDGGLPEAWWHDLETKLLLRQTSAYLYAAFLAAAFGIEGVKIPENMRAEAFCCDPGALVDPQYTGLLQATYTRNARRLPEYDHGRITAVLFQFDRT